ncbi:CBO0543 family protein [Bacillus sp. 31A1R]|uniref:CBO0543 family protein n=1 Tax=Robertmurraya mangrovi TaxID=3098077 RepID=A0ABU5IWJ5_9BACI|nr:CBO0543 family protein [Bacillus sp. 31A1R]MDZ5471506.1 CBO0543 family protein [Bacillus sp. 31A1R]
MYLIFVVIVYIIFAKLFVDWKRWKEYYPTILFFIVCNLLYNFVFYNHTLWRYRAVTIDWLNHTLIELTFTFFIVPVVIMIYLRYYPTGKRQFFYLAAWIIYFSFIEFLFEKRGLFVYENGWDLKWSVLFNVIMFTMVRTHYRNPLLAMIISLPIIIILLFIFHPSISELK